MTLTNQPIWKYAGHIGDVDPLSYGGGFVYVDETGVYPPELTYFEPATDDEWQTHRDNDKQDEIPITVYRIVLDRPRFKTLTEEGKRHSFSTKELPANERGKTWYWYEEWFVRDLASVAATCDTTKFAMLRDLFSKDARERAFAYETLIQHFGANNFDSYPLTLTEKEAREQYAAELKQTR